MEVSASSDLTDQLLNEQRCQCNVYICDQFTIMGSEKSLHHGNFCRQNSTLEVSCNRLKESQEKMAREKVSSTTNLCCSTCPEASPPHVAMLPRDSKLQFQIHASRHSIRLYSAGFS